MTSQKHPQKGRLAIDDDRIEALPPKNKKEYQDLIGGSLGSLITSR
jgi:hypothetical protein